MRMRPPPPKDPSGPAPSAVTYGRRLWLCVSSASKLLDLLHGRKSSVSSSFPFENALASVRLRSPVRPNPATQVTCAIKQRTRLIEFFLHLMNEIDTSALLVEQNPAPAAYIQQHGPGNVRYWQILLKKSKIERLPKSSRTRSFLGVST